MEHRERQEERERELRSDADELEQQGDELEQRGSDLDKQVDNVREEFQRRQQASDVPGAQQPNEVTEDLAPRASEDTEDAPEDEDD